MTSQIRNDSSAQTIIINNSDGSKQSVSTIRNDEGNQQVLFGEKLTITGNNIINTSTSPNSVFGGSF